MQQSTTKVPIIMPSHIHGLLGRFTLKFLFIFSTFILFLLGFTTGADAARLAEEETVLPDLVGPVLDAFATGQPVVAAMLALVLIAALASRYGAKKWPWLAGSTGKASLVMLGAFGASGAAALMGGGSLSLALLGTAVMVAVQAAGGYSLVKSLVIDPLRPLVAKGPVWLQFGFSMLSWMFNKPVKPDPGITLAKAEKAGDEAVADMKAAIVKDLTFKDVP